MANFNEKINSHKEFVLRDQEYDYFVERIRSMKKLKSKRETIDEAIRTYKREVEKMDEKVEKLVRRNDDYM